MAASLRLACLAGGLLACLSGCAMPGARGYVVVGDAIPLPFDARTGDAVRGRALLVARGDANCVVCHAFPDPALPLAGDVGPSLSGIGVRLSRGQLRLRIADMRSVDPGTAMPGYHRIEGLQDVAPAYRGRPVLTAQEVEDLVAYLATLR